MTGPHPPGGMMRYQARPTIDGDEAHARPGGRRPSRAHGHRLIRERPGEYQPDPDRSAQAAGQPATSAEEPAAAHVDLAARVVAGVEQLAARPVDELDEAGLREELGAVDDAIRRLDARRCRLTAAIVERQRRRARQARPGDARAGEKAARRTQNELGKQLQWAPGEAKRATKVGEQAARTPAVGRALDQGALTPRHATLLADTLRWLDPTELETAELQLVEAAQTQDPATFGRTCRRLLAELDHDAATQELERRHGRRALRIFDTDDGMTRISGQVAGLDAEALYSAVHGFRRPDSPGEHRQPEQATADALTAALNAAMRSSETPRRHGVPAQVIVTFDHGTLATGAGVAEGQWTGPMPFSEAHQVLTDCAAGRLVLDADQLPMEVSETVRTVPAALWRALVRRDGGCIARGCDQPPQWCQVMHLVIPFKLGGRLTLPSSALGCAYHHRRYDRGRMQLTWDGRRPTLHDRAAAGPMEGLAATAEPADGPTATDSPTDEGGGVANGDVSDPTRTSSPPHTGADVRGSGPSPPQPSDDPSPSRTPSSTQRGTQPALDLLPDPGG